MWKISRVLQELREQDTRCNGQHVSFFFKSPHNIRDETHVDAPCEYKFFGYPRPVCEAIRFFEQFPEESRDFFELVNNFSRPLENLRFFTNRGPYTV